MTEPTAPRPVVAALSPCPFCGGEAEIVRQGTPRQSTQYGCTNCGCSLETCEEWDFGGRWNERPGEDAARQATREAERRAEAEVLAASAVRLDLKTARAQLAEAREREAALDHGIMRLQRENAALSQQLGEARAQAWAGWERAVDLDYECEERHQDANNTVEYYEQQLAARTAEVATLREAFESAYGEMEEAGVPIPTKVELAYAALAALAGTGIPSSLDSPTKKA